MCAPHLLADSVVAQSVALQTAVFGLLGVIAVLGMLAVVSPRHFAQIADRGSQWVDSSQFFRRLDEPLNPDKHVLRYSRIFGVAVLFSVLFLGWMFSQFLL